MNISKSFKRVKTIRNIVVSSLLCLSSISYITKEVFVCLRHEGI